MENRLAPLDGLRGLAAVSVVLSHALFAFAPWLMQTSHPKAQTSFPEPDHWAGVVGGALPTVLFNGHFAVCVFFALSGVVLARGTEGPTGALCAARRVIGRYPRLMLPVLAAALLGWAFMAVDAMRFLPRAAALSGSTWFAAQYQFAPNLPAAFQQGVWGALFQGHASYNPPFWTMRPEMLGSLAMLVFLTVIPWRVARYVLLIPALLLAGVVVDKTLLVLGGCMLACAVLSPLAAHRFPRWVGVGIIVAGVILGGYDHSVGMAWLRAIAEPVARAMSFGGDDALQIVHAFGAMLLVFGVMLTPWAQSVLSAKPLVWLGENTFAIYLVHFPILCSLGAAGFVLASPASAGLATVLATLLTLLATVVAAVPFTVLIDKPAIGLSRRIGGLLSLRGAAEPRTRSP